MAGFDKNGLRCVAPGGVLTAGTRGPSLYLYVSNDTLATIATANYFDPVIDQLVVGDIILVAADLDGTPAHNTYLVSGNTGTHVTLTVSA